MVAGQCWRVRVWRLCRLHLRFRAWAVRQAAGAEPHRRVLVGARSAALICRLCPLRPQYKTWAAWLAAEVQPPCPELVFRLCRRLPQFTDWEVRLAVDGGAEAHYLAPVCQLCHLHPRSRPWPVGLVPDVGTHCPVLDSQSCRLLLWFKASATRLVADAETDYPMLALVFPMWRLLHHSSRAPTPLAEHRRTILPTAHQEHQFKAQATLFLMNA